MPRAMGLFVAACGGAVGAPSADEGTWPPVSLGGHEVIPGPLEDLAIDPATGRPYDGPSCEGPIRLLEPNEQIELNEGAILDGRLRMDLIRGGTESGPSNLAPWSWPLS